jgi:hypothetical protein
MDLRASTLEAGVPGAPEAQPNQFPGLHPPDPMTRKGFLPHECRFHSLPFTPFLR